MESIMRKELVPPPSCPAPLKVLGKWPNACLPDHDCEISGVLYPAPTSLDAEGVDWWLDFLQVRVGASRNLVGNVTAGMLGGMFGLAAAGAGLAVANGMWQAALATLGGLALVVLLGTYFAADSDHAALEQRWMLYRQRARDLEHSQGPRPRASADQDRKGRPESRVENSAKESGTCLARTENALTRVTSD